MHLKRLEVFGFKSFADKTVLEFQPGITAIVGPNGCGKSNVFDAVRWVLGEQSVKDLRGSAMEDVIFSGTDKKAPLGFAEVHLTFSNERRVLAVDTDEVTVSRRLFRSGESEYLINKNTSRLKDVVELFLGTGVGAEAYSLIQQGKVDLVVSAKPDDRRQIFDEAAGITKYKSKKKEALSKLKETEDNLLRINDIVVEVKRQIATIERQAKKAQRYKEDFEQLKTFETLMAQYELSRFDGEKAEIEAALSDLATKEQEAMDQLAQLNEQLDAQNEALEEYDLRINELKERAIRMDNDVQMNERQIIFNQERLTNLEETVGRLEQDKAAAKERCEQMRAKIAQLQENLAMIVANCAAIDSRLNTKRGELNAFIDAIAQAQQSIKATEVNILTLNSSEVRIKNQLTENLKRVMEALARKSRLETENSKVITEKDQVIARCLAIDGAIVSVKSALDNLWTDLHNKRQVCEEMQLKTLACEDTIDQLGKNRLFLISQKEFIEKLQIQYQDSPDPVVEGRFISTIRPTENQTGIIGKIKNIQVIPNADGNGEVYEITYETKYVELDLKVTDDRTVQLDAQIAEALQERDVLAGQTKEANAAVDAVLKGIQEEEKKMSVLEAQKNDIELETGKLTGELEAIGSESIAVESTLASLKIEESQLDAQLQDITNQINAAQAQIKDTVLWIDAENVKREQFNVQIVQMEGELAQAIQSRQTTQDNVDVYTQNLDRDMADIGRFDTQILEAESKKARNLEEISTLEATIETVKKQLQGLNAQLDEIQMSKNEVQIRLNIIRSQAKAFEEQVIEAKTQLHNHQMRSQEIAFTQRSIKERLLQAYKVNLDEVLQPVLQPPTNAIESLEGVSDIAQDIQASETGVEAAVPQPAPQINYEELSTEIDRLRKRCESYGAVNLVAIEEFDELKQRFEFLTQQQADLLTARESLLGTIQKINRTTRQMFTDTFTRVNEEFVSHFKSLFGGGEAQLILLDPENALECGIDIVARPPGKKLQNISLLSGGEKTMTAIALIFSVFKVNPSPFCVLDEIDAALDESNVGRFAQTLKEFAKIAQFIVITHNKRTMNAADVMYGVTMQERGISRIVSVNFNEYKQPEVAKPAIEAAQAPVAAGV